MYICITDIHNYVLLDSFILLAPELLDDLAKVYHTKKRYVCIDNLNLSYMYSYCFKYLCISEAAEGELELKMQR